MKRFNVNSILFVFVIAFIIVGIRGECFTRLKRGALDMLAAVRHFSISGATDAKTAVDKAVSEDLSYHDAMMDIDSVKNNLLGTRVVEKDDTTVVKADSGSLMEPSNRLDDSEIDDLVSRFLSLQRVSNENGAKFLYCFAPVKSLYETGPSNINNYSGENCERFLRELRKEHIPLLDLSKSLRDGGIEDSDIYYYTDHHWKAYSGFIAAGAICKELSSLYGFAFDARYTDINNYSVANYPDWFLGSKGKKVGTYFTRHGADDFELITPNFETSLAELQPFGDQIREGAFEDTVLYMYNMKKDRYHANPYATYSGGDFYLQIVRNNLNPNGEKILLIRDSFACVVAPFLSLQTGELHICDMRVYDWRVGNKINVEKYMQEINPDYVIVLYAGIGRIDSAWGKYDFFD